MKLEKALAIAERIRGELSPWCDRIEIAGSIRRKCPDVGDIEIVCIPRRYENFDMFNRPIGQIPIQEFVHTVRKWKKIRGEPFGRYTARMLPEGIQLDLFMTTPDKWGLIYAIRTGSASYSHHVLGNAWVRSGYKAIDGELHSVATGQIVPIREERDLFLLLGIPWIEPEKRDIKKNHSKILDETVQLLNERELE